jgi:hypothetical protein
MPISVVARRHEAVVMNLLGFGAARRALAIADRLGRVSTFK